MGTPIGFFPGATPDAYRAMGDEASAQRLEAALAGPTSAYVPGTGAAAGGASALSGGVQLVPDAPGYDFATALPILQEEIAPYDPAVRDWLKSINKYNETAQTAVERVLREDALREAARQAVVSGQISQGEAQNIVTGITPPPPNIQAKADSIANSAISSGISAGLNDMSTITGTTNTNFPVYQDLLDRNVTGFPSGTGGSTTPRSSYVQGMTAPLAPGEGESMIDPTISPYLGEALARSRYLFLTGPGPELYPEQMYVSPSQQTLQALQQAETLATSPQAQALGQQGLQAYGTALGGLESMAAGDYLQSPEYQRYLESVTRPVTEQVTQQILPSIASQYSTAGRYGSGAMAQATGKATELGTRALGDVTAQVANQQQGRMLEAQTALPTFLGQLPSVMQGALAPSTALAGVGAQREAIAAQPLQEKIQRFEYAQNLPFNMLQGYLGSIYGSPLGTAGAAPQAQSNTTLQNLGALVGIGAGIGQISQTPFGSFLGGVFK